MVLTIGFCGHRYSVESQITNTKIMECFKVQMECWNGMFQSKKGFLLNYQGQSRIYKIVNKQTRVFLPQRFLENNTTTAGPLGFSGDRYFV